MPSSFLFQTSRSSSANPPAPLVPAAPWQVYSQHQQQPNQSPAGSSAAHATDPDPLDTDEDDHGGMDLGSSGDNLDPTAPLELLFDDLETFFYFGRIGAGAVAAQQEFHHVGGHRVLAGVFAHQVLAHQVLADQEAITGLGAELIELVHLAGGSGGAGHGNTSS
jgi:hypothetical protein